MSQTFVNKLIVDRDKAKSNEVRNIHMLRYTGNDLVMRDMRKLIEVIYRNFEQLNSSPELNHTKREIARLLTSPKSVIIVGTLNKSIVCYLVAEITSIDNLKQLMHIYYLYTAPLHRGHGLATYMLNLIQKYSNEVNITILSLTFDTYDKMLEKFYYNNGFVYDPNLRSYQRHDMMVKYI